MSTYLEGYDLRIKIEKNKITLLDQTRYELTSFSPSIGSASEKPTISLTLEEESGKQTYICTINWTKLD